MRKTLIEAGDYIVQWIDPGTRELMNVKYRELAAAKRGALRAHEAGALMTSIVQWTGVVPKKIWEPRPEYELAPLVHDPVTGEVREINPRKPVKPRGRKQLFAIAGKEYRAGHPRKGAQYFDEAIAAKNPGKRTAAPVHPYVVCTAKGTYVATYSSRKAAVEAAQKLSDKTDRQYKVVLE